MIDLRGLHGVLGDKSLSVARPVAYLGYREIDRSGGRWHNVEEDQGRECKCAERDKGLGSLHELAICRRLIR